MTRIVHLVDDTGMGGVMRLLDTLTGRLGESIENEVVRTDATIPLPPLLSADFVLVHLTASWSKLPYLTALRALQPRTPIVIVEHSYTAAFERLHVARTGRFHIMLRAAYALADRVVAVSHGQASWLREARLVAPAKIRVIPSVSDCDRLFDLPLPERREGPLRLGALGRYAEQKGFDVLIEAMSRLPEGIAHLTLAGAGPEADSLRQAAAGLPTVDIGPAITDSACWLAERDAVVVPSRYEAFGLVALEARAAGRSLIASAIDGLIEQVPCGAGQLVPPCDAEALAAAIIQLSQADLAPLSARARSSARNHIETSIRAWQTLFDEIGEQPVRKFVSARKALAHQCNGNRAAAK
jgi:glycosyltransferase involved in cell wall biosynthesis